MKHRRIISIALTLTLLASCILPFNTFADEKILSDIEVVNNQGGSNYKGQPFNGDSITVTAIYDDGSSAQISEDEYDIANYNSDAVGKVEMTVSYGGFSKDVVVDIKDTDFLYPIGKEVSLSVMSGKNSVASWRSSNEAVVKITGTRKTWVSSQDQYKQTVSIKVLKAGFSILSCTANDGTVVGEATISVRKSIEKFSIPTELYAVEGATYNLEAAITPVDAAEQRVSWSSSDMDIATVNRQGEVTALQTGDTVITASSWDGKHTADCVVHVIERGNMSFEDVIFVNGDNVRIYGHNRYSTSIKAADELKKGLGISKFENIIIADGDNYADALAGSYLAKVKNAPILVIGDRESNWKPAVDYVKKNLKDDGTVYLLGGTGAVPQVVEDALTNQNVKRLAGSNRWLTNIAILEETGVEDSDILVCSGMSFPDSLSASAVGKPILLVDKKLFESQQEYLGNIEGKRFCLIGGTGAVSETVDTALQEYGETVRIAGDDRYETSRAVAETFFGCEDGHRAITFACGNNFPDGLSGGPLAMALNAPLILVNEKNTYWAEDYVDAQHCIHSLTMGGPALISDKAVNKIMS